MIICETLLSTRQCFCMRFSPGALLMTQMPAVMPVEYSS